VEFLAVYVREAHPSDGWRMSSNDRVGILFSQPRQLTERIDIAKKCCNTLAMTIPLVVDGIDDAVGHAYSGMPDRLYLIDKDGRIAYKGGRGPFGFNARELEQSILMNLLDQLTSGERTLTGLPLPSNTEAWRRLPPAEIGGNSPLPAWARALAPSLPRTTASMLELEYLLRGQGQLDPELRAKMRWVAAHANQCRYTEAQALADLRRAGVHDFEIEAFQKDDSNLPAGERAALAFARKMTVDASSVTDAEMAQLLGEYGNKQVVAMVLLLAYANFQDRLILSLGVANDKDSARPPEEIRFNKDTVVPVPPRRPQPPRSAAVAALAGARDSDWMSQGFSQLQRVMEDQRARQPRILVPAWEDVRKYMPPQSANRPVRVRWSLVCMGYQPELATAWFGCLSAFRQEARQDRVFEESLFWVITRTLNCFY
jgi:alkylhydroperoxidase family enzyme